MKNKPKHHFDLLQVKEGNLKINLYEFTHVNLNAIIKAFNKEEANTNNPLTLILLHPFDADKVSASGNHITIHKSYSRGNAVVTVKKSYSIPENHIAFL